MSDAPAGQVDGQATQVSESDRPKDASDSGDDEKSPLVRKSINLLELSTQMTWMLNCAGTLLCCIPCYLVQDFSAPSVSSTIFDGCWFLSLGLALVIASVVLACQGEIPDAIREWVNPAYYAFAAFFALALLTGHVAFINKPLVDLVTLAMPVACAIGVLATLDRQPTILYAYAVFWSAYWLALLISIYYLMNFIRNTRQESWQPRLTDLWERTVVNAPEVICSLQEHYACSGFTFPCKWWPKRVAGYLPDRFQRPQCADCGSAAPTSCQKALQASLAQQETSIAVSACLAGAIIVAFVGTAATTLYLSLKEEGEAERVARANREREMKQAEPIVQAILQCRMAMMNIVKELDAGKIIPQEAFTQLMMRIDAIDLSPVEDGPMKERLRLAKKQHIDQVEILSQRALEMARIARGQTDPQKTSVEASDTTI